MGSTIYDTNPFAYVGNNEYYQQLSARDLEIQEINEIFKESGIDDKELYDLLIEPEDESYMTEGANIEMVRSANKYKLTALKSIREVRKLYKNGDFKEAHKKCQESIKGLENARDEIDRILVKHGDTLGQAVIGTIISGCITIAKGLIIGLIAFKVMPKTIVVHGFRVKNGDRSSDAFVAGIIGNEVISLKNHITVLKHAFTSRKFTFKELNPLRHQIKDAYGKYISIMKILDRYIVKLENKTKESEKVTKESAKVAEESSASVNGQMLAQGDGKAEPVKKMVADMEAEFDEETDEDDEVDEVFEEAFNNTVTGDDYYFEASVMDILRDKLRTSGAKAPHSGISIRKVTEAAKLYSSIQMSKGRIRVAVAKDPSANNSTYVKTEKKKIIAAEKKLRKIKSNFYKEETDIFTKWCNAVDSHFKKSIDAKVKSAKKASIKKESVNDILIEKADKDEIDDRMKPIIEKLNEKGYKTKYSSAGHNTLTKKEDTTKNGVEDGHLYTDARLVFDGHYNLPKAPKYWYWKKVEGDDDYLDVEEVEYKTTEGGPSKAFYDWREKYMNSLKNWVDDLPDADSHEEPDDNSTENEENVTESVDNVFDSIMTDLFIDATLE